MSSLAIRTDTTTHHHHIWLKNGTWWCQFTVHRPWHRSSLVQCSLCTQNRSLGRQRRDQLFGQMVCRDVEVPR